MLINVREVHRVNKPSNQIYTRMVPSPIRIWIHKKISYYSGLGSVINALQMQVIEQQEKLLLFKEINEQLKNDAALAREQVSELRALIEARENRLHPFVKDAISFATQNLAPAFLLTGENSETRLGQLFDRHGSDKNARHSYAHYYEQLLDGLEEPRILEVGLGSLGPYPYAGLKPGGSIKAWRERYPNAVIAGGDIDPQAVSEVTEVAFQVDQTSAASLEAFAHNIAEFGPFDLIIDDGFHDPHANLLTALNLIDSLSPNGHYIIEDIHSSLIDLWRLMLDSTNLHGQIIDMSALRPDTDDNVLICIKRLA